MTAIEGFCLRVEDIGAVVENGLEIGGTVLLSLGKGGAVAASCQMVGDACLLQLREGLAAEVVEEGRRKEPRLWTTVLETGDAEGGVACLAELTDYLFLGFLGILGGLRRSRWR